MKMNGKMLAEAAMRNRAVRKDSRYRTLLTKCQKYEGEYCRILASLPPADQDILEEYISLCQELEYRRGQVDAGTLLKK